MAANSFGKNFVVTSFGESHGIALGVVIDGCPAGLEVDLELLKQDLQRRRPGSSAIVSARNEQDEAEILSGVFEGKTIGTPIAVIVRNKDQRSGDYSKIKNEPRKGHADDLWLSKFGHSDYRGGGRSSGRETLCRVIAGSFAKMLLKHYCPELKVFAFSSKIYDQSLTPGEIKAVDSSMDIGSFAACFPDKEKSKIIENLLLKAKEEGKSYGGNISLVLENPPRNLGQPVFHKFKSDLAAALLSIGATTAISIGAGFSSGDTEGVQFHSGGEDQYGGIRGGITTGDNVYAEIAFKPTSTVLDHAKKGRHDPCILPRAVPVVEAMANLVLIDHVLWAMRDKIEG